MSYGNYAMPLLLSMTGCKKNNKMTKSANIPMKTELKDFPFGERSSADSTEKIMSKGRILKNLLVVCFGFLFQFSAYQALANLQSTLNMADNLGVASQSVIYAALIISSLFLPKLVIKKLGCKMTLVLSILTYAPYIAANFYPHMGTFVPTAIILGLGAAPLWSAKCTYINEISSMYSKYTSDTVDVITSKFFGVFFMIFQNTQIFGNLVSFIVLKPSENKNTTSAVDRSRNNVRFVYSDSILWQAPNLTKNATCGLNFENEINDQLEPPPEDKRYMLIGIYLGCVILASIIVAVFLDPLKRKEKMSDGGICSRVVATLKHMKKPEQILLIPITIFSGLEQAFILGDYTKAYVACVWGLHTVGLVFICFGVVNAIMSFLAGRILKHVPRQILMLVGTAGNIGVCIALYLWNPKKDEFVYAFVIIGVWGLSDAIWQTQINALYGSLFRSEEEAGFANYRLWESLGFSIAFAYSSFISVAHKIYVLLAFLIIGMTGYMTVEFKKGKSETYVISDSK